MASSCQRAYFELHQDHLQIPDPTYLVIFLMKKKELKNLARKIADAELIIQTSNDKVAIKNAENEIIKLSGSVSSVLDMMALDEMVQKFLEKK